MQHIFWKVSVILSSSFYVINLFSLFVRDLYRADICHRMATLRLLYFVSLTYIFNIKSFIEVDIRHRIASLRIFYLVTLIKIFKVKQLKG